MTNERAQTELPSLKGCPFCGSAPKAERSFPDHKGPACYIGCPKCDTSPDGCYRKADEWEQAVECWNTRTPSPETPVSGDERECTVCHAKVASFDEAMCCHCETMPWKRISKTAPTPSDDVSSLIEQHLALLYESLGSSQRKMLQTGIAAAIAATNTEAAIVLKRYRELIAECSKRFREYQRIHEGKIEPKHEFVPADLREKIERNREMADACDAALKAGA